MSKTWLNSFEAFKSDMGARPSPEHSIDRIDNDGDYCKENCHWATSKEQNRNTRGNRHIKFKGKIYTIAGAAESFGLSWDCLESRLSRGWSIKKALETPARSHRIKHKH